MNKCKAIIVILFLLSGSSNLYPQKKQATTSYPVDNKIIYCLCYSPGGGTLSIGDGNAIKMYSTDNKKLIKEFSGGHTRQILSIDISHDSTTLVSGGKDSLIIVRNLIDGRIKKRLDYSKGIVTSVKLSTDNRLLASACTDKSVYVYDILKDSLKFKFTDSSGEILCVALSPDNSLLAASGTDGSIRLYDLNKGTLLTTLKGHKSWAREIVFNNDGSKLLSCGDDGQIISWKLSDSSNIQQVRLIHNSLNWITGIDYNADSKTYTFGCADGKVKIISPVSTYKTNVRVLVNQIRFKPNVGADLVIGVATRGKGVLEIHAKYMKSEN